jgi:hypothetical protein
LQWKRTCFLTMPQSIYITEWQIRQREVTQEG